MANWKARASNDAAGALECEYDVFLNFRGEDTRHDFTDFLYDRLVDAGVHTFRDEEKLPFGDVISDRLERAINNSKLYISVFSQNYASSKWCLRELKLIIDNVSNSRGQKSIFPIFLLVKPDDVKLKTRLDSDAPYEAAFKEHEKKFPDEVEAWKTALGKVDEHKGLVVEKNTSQAAIVKSVVKEVLKKLKVKTKLVTEHLLGLDDQVKDLMEFLDVNHDDVRLIGIYGMGGIGKTTIAKVIFNQLCSHFGKCCSFLEGIRERSTKEGLVLLQKKLISDVGGSESVEKINDTEEGMRTIKKTLSKTEVLVVLDDVNKKEHIVKLIGNTKLHSGSRIIITTRDMVLLQVEGFKGEIRFYEMLKMDDDLALQLFCQHAFTRDFPSNDYCRLSSEIISRMGGLPLAIEVVGSLLKGRNEAFWKETLARLKKEPEEEILKKLRISYDDLDKYQKQIFLDIACFMFNKKKTDAIYMWASCLVYPERGIDALTNRCLIKILDNDKIWMHDQLIDLGRRIVHEESQDDIEKQSRLWIAEEALQIILTKKRKHEVQALELSRDGPPIEIRNEDFERLPNLRFLDLKGGTFVGDFVGCNSKLRWFSWSASGKNFRTNNFRANNLCLNQLVVCKLLEIHFNDDSKAWDLIKRAQNLKVLSITWCSGITTIPDVSRCSTLERLTIVKCFNLKRIESFIGDLQSLIELKITWCMNITDLPKEVGTLVKLKCFSLEHCERLGELPSSVGNLTSLTELDLSGTKITELSNSIVQLKSLRILRSSLGLSHNIRDDRDWQLPSGFGTLVNLEELDLSGRNGMKGEISVEIGELSSLRILRLDRTRIYGIPRTINKLHQLQILDLSNCDEIQELPELPTSLTHLSLQSLSLLSIPNMSKLTNLVNLLLSNGSYYRGKSNLISGCDLSWIGNLSRLEWLKLDLANIPAPLELASLSHLKGLVLKHLDLKSLVQLPSSDSSWRALSTLEISRCGVEYIPLDGLSQLEKLEVNDCDRLERLSIPSGLRKLWLVDVHSCPGLAEIQVVGILKSLKCLTVASCESLTKINGLSYLKNLQEISIRFCNVLTSVKGLNELESLKCLNVWHCQSLRRLIDASCTKIPDNCRVCIWECGYFIKDSVKSPPSVKYMKRYRDEILRNTSDKMEHPFTINFILNIKLFGGVFSATRRKKKDVALDSVTYIGLIAEIIGFGFLMKRMCYQTADEDRELFIEIKGDEQVDEVVQLASERRSIHLIVDAGVGISLKGAIIRAARMFGGIGTVRVFILSFCVAFFLYLSLLTGKLDFPRKKGQLAGMRRFSLCEDFVVIFVVHLILFLVKNLG